MLALFPQAAAGRSTPRIVTIRDAEKESLLRAYADPLSRAAGVWPAAVRIKLIQVSAINAFVATGNRMFIHTGLIQKADSAAKRIGVLPQAKGHLAGDHLVDPRNATLATTHTGPAEHREPR